ncbi:MAG: hypothetical protein COA78_32515 [Blastopirellula sp.]|nr:MAG: hypothetical protein COA78_32515 [Blastopirellula sp.]
MSTINKSGEYFRLRIKLDGSSKRINLGKKLTKRIERLLIRVVDQLEEDYAYDQRPEKETMEEFELLPEKIKDKLCACGLVQLNPVPKLEQFLTDYIDRKKSNVVAATITKLERSARYFVESFGDCDLSSVTEGDCEDYVEQRDAAVATIGAEVKHGRQFFKYAVKKKYLSENPWEDIPVGSQVGEKIPLDFQMLQTVNDYLPDAEWRCFFAVCRWTGCRYSEAFLLKWTDIQWDEGKIIMPSPKTARYGRPTREVPLFPELRQYLQEWFENAPDGAVYLASSLANENNRTGENIVNIRKPLKSFVEKAGFQMWKKPFQALRQLRENELERIRPSHVVQAWIGHSRSTAEKHYLSVMDDDFKFGCSSVIRNGQHLGTDGTGQERIAKNETADSTKIAPISSGSVLSVDGTNIPIVLGGLEPPIVSL